MGGEIDAAASSGGALYKTLPHLQYEGPEDILFPVEILEWDLGVHQGFQDDSWYDYYHYPVVWQGGENATLPTPKASATHNFQDYRNCGIDLDAPADQRIPRTRFTEVQRQTLNGWILDHYDNPYLSVSDRDLLANETGLSKAQVTNFVANYRRRKLLRVVPIPNVQLDACVQGKFTQGPVIQFENQDHSTGTSVDDMTGFRWTQNTRSTTSLLPDADVATTAPLAIPENLASPSTITPTSNDNPDSLELSDMRQEVMKVLENTPERLDDRQGASFLSSLSFSTCASSRSGRHDSDFDGQSVTTGLTSSASGSSSSSNSFASRRGRHAYRVSKWPPVATGSTEVSYSCTSCLRHFKKKSSLDRHVNSVHHVKNSWLCWDRNTLCVICRKPADTCGHRSLECWARPRAEREFFRRDAMRQHLSGYHRATNEMVTADMLDALCLMRDGAALSGVEALQDGTTERDMASVGESVDEEAPEPRSETWELKFCEFLMTDLEAYDFAEYDRRFQKFANGQRTG